MYRIIIPFLVLCCSVSLTAQNLEKKIPDKAGFVLCLNLNSLSQKINFNDLSQYNFLKKPENAESIYPSVFIKELFRLPEKAGFNKKDKIYLYSENHDTINNFNYMISLTDVKLFQNRVMDILKTKQSQPKFDKEGKLKVLNYDHKLSIGVGKDYAIVSIWDADYYYSDDYYEYNEARGKVVAMIDSIRGNDQMIDTTAVTPQIDEVIEETVPPQEEPAVDSVIYEVEADYVDIPEPDYYSYLYENDSLMKRFERDWLVKKAKKEELFWLKKDKKMSYYHKYVADTKPANSVTANKEFTAIFANTHDIIYWFNYNSYSGKLMQMMEEKRYSMGMPNEAEEKPKPKQTIDDFIKNNGMYGLGNFEKGEIKMSFFNTFNDTIKPFIEKCYGNQINPEFFKYVKSDNLIGIAGMSVNMEAVANFYYEMFKRASESALNPNKYAIAAIEMTDIFLDKKAMYHTFKGDAIVAVTGIQSNLKTYTSYEYDTLTFENRSVEKTKTEYIPEFVVIATIENKSTLLRIINMIVKMEGLVKVSDQLYAFRSRIPDVNDKFFIVIKGDLFFITNDKTLATDQIANGISTSRTVGEKYNSYLNNSSFGFWDAATMFKLMSETPTEELSEPDMLKKLGDKINKGSFITRPIQGNIAQYDLSLEMKNRENSSLLEFLDLFEMVSNMRGFR